MQTRSRFPVNYTLVPQASDIHRRASTSQKQQALDESHPAHLNNTQPQVSMRKMSSVGQLETECLNGQPVHASKRSITKERLLIPRPDPGAMDKPATTVSLRLSLLNPITQLIPCKRRYHVERT